MNTPINPEVLALGAELLGWDARPAGQAKRMEDLALLQEMMATTGYLQRHQGERK